MTYRIQAIVTKRVTAYIEAANRADADERFHAGHFEAHGDEVVGWEAAGELELVCGEEACTKQ
jgi:hypothetical protein